MNQREPCPVCGKQPEERTWESQHEDFGHVRFFQVLCRGHLRSVAIVRDERPADIVFEAVRKEWDKAARERRGKK